MFHISGFDADAIIEVKTHTGEWKAHALVADIADAKAVAKALSIKHETGGGLAFRVRSGHVPSQVKAIYCKGKIIEEATA